MKAELITVFVVIFNICPTLHKTLEKCYFGHCICHSPPKPEDLIETSDESVKIKVEWPVRSCDHKRNFVQHAIVRSMIRY